MGLGLEELQQHVQSANERLLMAKLLEAGKIMEEQETVSRSRQETTPLSVFAHEEGLQVSSTFLCAVACGVKIA